MESMNLGNFSLLKEDSDHYTVGHPRGAVITVPKNGLSDKAHEMIRKLRHQKMADGGEVADQSSEIPISEQFPEPANSSPALSGDNFGMNATAPDQESAPEQMGPDATAANMDPGASSPSPVGADGIPLLSNAGLEQAKQSLQGGVNAEAAIGQKEAQAYGAMPKLATPDEILAQNQAKDNSLFQAYADKKIDPDRYWNNKDTGSKITTGIGLLLSGIGSGLSGQPNFAMQRINDAINKDIEAQQSDKSSAMNLWKMNHEMLGNKLAANAATQNQYLNAAKIKIMQAQGQFAGPLAQARAAQGILGIDQQIAQNNRLQALLDPRTQSQIDPSILVPHLVPPDHQKEVFQEINQAKAATQNQAEMNSLFDQANVENTVLKTGAGLLRTPPSIKAMDALALPMIHDAEGRVNEFEQHTIQNLYPQPGDSKATVNQKRLALNAFINQKRQASTAKGYGIDLTNYRNTAAIPQIMQKDKINFQKVPGGWIELGPAPKPMQKRVN